MIISVTKGNKALILGALLLVSTSSQAYRTDEAAVGHACDAPSPTLLRLGEERYYNLAPVKAALTAGEIDQLQKLYDHLQGRWRGEWNDNYCVAGGDNAGLRINSRQLRRVTANLRQHGQLSFRADGLMLDLAAASELTSLEFQGKETVVMTWRSPRGTHSHPYSVSDNTSDQDDSEQPTDKPGEKLRQPALRERHDTLSLQDNKLRLETRWFINGFYSGRELTTLHRVR